ncbi:MAG: VWA domain-containing protein [Deltaproteobacteria bacterium]|nr:VWA domain-containing protein [Deltaproteobacteria bacterium]
MSRSLSLAFTIAGAFLLTASCGSRTGLFGSEPGTITNPEAGTVTETSRPDAPTDGPVPCTPGKFDFELAAAQLMFVIDRSGSMAFSLDGQQPGPFGLPPGVPSRWQALRDAVFQTILPFDGSLAMGAKFYPEVAPRGAPVEEACGTDVGVGIAPARNNAASIVNVFDTTEPIGGTPTAEAIRLAAQYLTGTRGVARTLVVATDGAPNCNGNLDADRCTCTARRANGSFACDGPDGQYNCLDDLRSINTIKNIFDNQKIPVYVIGIGSTERPEFLKVLDDMAVAGGRARPTTPRHYNVQSASELKAALGSIQESVAKCTYLTPSAPTDPSAITVELDGKPVPRDVTQTNGWDWLDQAYGTLQFFGPSCEAASAAAKPTITGVVRCEPR